MGRKAKISKEMILEAAFELLDESGLSAVAIKNIAAKLECSTQPISWQFGSMTELKKELFMYSAMRMWGSLEAKMEKTRSMRFSSAACITSPSRATIRMFSAS